MPYLYILTTVPVPSLIVNILNNQTVGQSLTLECIITTVRGITSRVDVAWNSNGSELNAVKGVNISSSTNDSLLLTNTYIIPQLSTADEGKEYLCEISLDTEPLVTATSSVVLHVTGKDDNMHKYITVASYMLSLL